MSDEFFPYLVRIEFPETLDFPSKKRTLVVFSGVTPDYMGGGCPKDQHAFNVEAKNLISPSREFVILNAEMMVWAMSTRAVYLDDSAEKIKEYLA